MDVEETHGLGYGGVDDDPSSSVLLATMDATAGWEAIRHLRDWERAQLRLSPGQRLLDVGCGLGDAALALCGDLGASGELVGIDASAEMIAAARSRARDAESRVRFETGDAATLDERDDSFDVVRCERTLQWLTVPQEAVTEMARVTRPGGLVSLLDTDWSTFEIDIDDDDIARIVRNAMQTERGRPSNVGRRLADRSDAGLDVVAQTQATHRSLNWDPDESPAPDGCFSMTSLAADLVDAGHLPAVDQERFVNTIHDAAREGRFAIALTMFAVVARRPPPVR